jgi:hypothetical protein
MRHRSRALQRYVLRLLHPVCLPHEMFYIVALRQLLPSCFRKKTPAPISKNVNIFSFYFRVKKKYFQNPNIDMTHQKHARKRRACTVIGFIFIAAHQK